MSFDVVLMIGINMIAVVIVNILNFILIRKKYSNKCGPPCRRCCKKYFQNPDPVSPVPVRVELTEEQKADLRVDIPDWSNSSGSNSSRSNSSGSNRQNLRVDIPNWPNSSDSNSSIREKSKINEGFEEDLKEEIKVEDEEIE